MNSPSLYLFLFLHHSLLLYSNIIYAANSPPPYVPTDNILVNCGATSNKTSVDGRKWDIDARLKYRLSPNILKNSRAVSIDSEKEPSVDEVPYSNACVFHSKFTYTFPLSSAGQKFLRLYFYPANYSSNYSISYDTTKSFFSVDRPTMGDVVWSLEFALQLQESNEKLDQKILAKLDKNNVHLLSGAKYNNDDLLSTTSNSTDGFMSGSLSPVLRSCTRHQVSPDGSEKVLEIIATQQLQQQLTMHAVVIHKGGNYQLSKSSTSA